MTTRRVFSASCAGLVALALDVFSIAAIAVTPTQVAPDRQGFGQQQAKGAVLGRVVDADTGGPIGGASVELRPTTPPARGASTARRFVLTDGNGRFVFPDVEAGGYGVFVLFAGRIPAQYGQRRPGGPSDRLDVGPTLAVTEVTVRMWRFASIEGIVRDETGDPAVGVEVRCARAMMAGGRRMLATEPAFALTDDRGAYRLANLWPGRHAVFVASRTESVATSTARGYTELRASPDAEAKARAALNESRAIVPSLAGLRVGSQIVLSQTLDGAAAPLFAADGRFEVHPTTYYPAARTAERATPVEVASGDDRRDVNLQLSTAPAVEVSGMVTGPVGPAAGLGVRIFAEDVGRFAADTGMETAATTTDADGRFTFLGVPPGRYTVKALRVTRPAPDAGSGMPPSAASADEGGTTFWAEQELTVGDADLSGISLQLTPGAHVTGRIQFEGARAPSPGALTRFLVQLTPVAGQREAAFLRPPAAQADGTFQTLAFPPGRYFIDVLAASAGPRWFVKSIAVAGIDQADRPLELGGEDITGVLVTMTDRLGAVTGRVSPSRDGRTDALVLVFPADYRAWMVNGMPMARTGMTNTDADGRFAIGGLRPGSYLAVALPAETDVDLQNPDLVGELARLGIEIRLGDNGPAPVTLSISRLRGRRP